ncbi:MULTISPECIES: hypothetical protein [Calothrix]|uniref:Uncharacterized protein n=2 Tax=Calothrix TaxID=1186 RepID=A0ABR8AI34_9CYAN|nr:MULTISPECIES: hypothetical protein [Calothrix]MBD2198217.1 hypothetical protein [Calothrix parietina FACHB-288]MBD2226555.1 hypothetical protein [Calothrix anomala FACHB-343]
MSACQSAAMGGEDGEDAMGSVAARLTHAGIPKSKIALLVLDAKQNYIVACRGIGTAVPLRLCGLNR